MKQMRSLKKQAGFWGALISAGISLYGASKSSSAANQMDRMAMEELAFMREQAGIKNARYDEMMGYLPQAFENEQFMADYIMRQNSMNRTALQDQMTYARDFTERSFGVLGEERDYEKYRVTQADRAAAEERTRQLQKLIDDERTSKAERERALEELSYTRAIASGERAYDVRSYESDKMRSDLEYQYRVGQYEKSVGIANEERQFEIDRQEKVLRLAGIMRGTIEEQLASFGDLEHPDRYGAEDVDQYTDEFYSAYQGDADRAADRLASVNEAGLMRRGVDVSSTGDSSRATLLKEQLVPLYDTARSRARQDAVGYINQLQTSELAGFNADVAGRTRSIQEALMGNSSMLQIMQEMNIPMSAIQNGWQNVGTGITQPRQLTSAGNYTAPVPIGSAITQDGVRNLGIDPSMSLATSRGSLNPSSYDASYNFESPNYYSPEDMFSMLSGFNSGSYSGGAFSTLAEGAASAGGAATKNLLDAGNNFAEFLKLYNG